MFAKLFVYIPRMLCNIIREGSLHPHTSERPTCVEIDTSASSSFTYSSSAGMRITHGIRVHEYKTEYFDVWAAFIMQQQWLRIIVLTNEIAFVNHVLVCRTYVGVEQRQQPHTQSVSSIPSTWL